MKVLIEKIKKWYEGEEKYSAETDPVFMIWQEYHWTAQVFRWLGKFYLNHWKWLIGTFIAIIALYLQYTG